MSCAITRPWSESGGAVRQSTPGEVSEGGDSSPVKSGLVAEGEISSTRGLVASRASKTDWVSPEDGGPTMACTPSASAR